MKVINHNGTIMESSDEFVISMWKQKGFEEVPEPEKEKKPTKSRRKRGTQNAD